MNASQKLHQAHLQEWAARFTEQKASGLTARAWCEQNHLSIHKYNYWKHQLKEAVVDQALPDIVPVSLPPACASTTPPSIQSCDSSPTSNQPVRTNRAIRPNYTNSNVRLCIDGVMIEVDPSVSEEFLRTLVRAVHYA